MNLIKTYNTNLLINIRSKHILKQIFGYLKEKKWLEIIKYNKNIQNKLNININYYKKYQRIEIEIFPILYNNKKNFFIKIPNIFDIINFHIYFNDDITEKKKNFPYPI